MRRHSHEGWTHLGITTDRTARARDVGRRGRNLNKCHRKAKQMLDSLEPKWNPLNTQPEDYEEAPTPHIELESGEKVFDTRITTRGSLGDAFRIFTDGLKGGDTAPQTRLDPEPDEDDVVVYTDGSATGNGRHDASAGSGAYYAEEDVRNLVIRVPEEMRQTNNVAEILAVKETIEANPKNIALRIKTDSKLVVDGLTANLRRWEDEGFENTENGHLIKVTVARLRERTAPTTFQWVKGHFGIEGNEKADRLADEGRLKDSSPIVDLGIPRNLLVPGAKLKNITQSLAYRIIRDQKMDKPAYQEALDRHTTARNLICARDAAADGEDDMPASSQIWKSVRHKDISRTIWYFLWMTIHEGYPLGEYWNKFPNLNSRIERPARNVVSQRICRTF
jgi:ribonuclease HI